jgi:hypothetical protein
MEYRVARPDVASLLAVPRLLQQAEAKARALEADRPAAAGGRPLTVAEIVSMRLPPPLFISSLNDPRLATPWAEGGRLSVQVRAMPGNHKCHSRLDNCTNT